MMQGRVVDLTLDESDDEYEDEGITNPSRANVQNNTAECLANQEVNESVMDDDALMQENDDHHRRLHASNNNSIREEVARPSINHALLIDDKYPGKILAPTATRPSNYNEQDQSTSNSNSNNHKNHLSEDQHMTDVRHEGGDLPNSGIASSAASSNLNKHDDTTSPSAHASFVMRSDPLFQHDPFLSPIQMELVWLAEESIHALNKKQPDWGFLYYYASAALRISLRGHSDWQACEDYEFFDKNHDTHTNDRLVQLRYRFLRQGVANALLGGYRRPLMREVIRKLRMRNRNGFVPYQSFPIPGG